VEVSWIPYPITDGISYWGIVNRSTTPSLARSADPGSRLRISAPAILRSRWACEIHSGIIWYMSRLLRSPLLPAVSTETGDCLLGSESCGNAHLPAMSFLSLLRSLTYHTACVSFIRFFKSAIFVSRFFSSSLKLALSFCSLLISSIAVSEFGAYSTIRALECLSLTSSVETFSSSLARYRSFSSVPPYIDTESQLCFVNGYLHGTTTTHDPSRILFAVDRRMIYD
jgi:hypothetical protein